MAKKKNQAMDWKFIVLLIGIVMVGLSVWALNQRVTYRSDAADVDKLKFCTEAQTTCNTDCDGITVIASDDSDLEETIANCKTQCQSSFANCYTPLRNKQQNCIIIGSANGGTRTVCGKSAVKREFNKINKRMGW